MGWCSVYGDMEKLTRATISTCRINRAEDDGLTLERPLPMITNARKTRIHIHIVRKTHACACWTWTYVHLPRQSSRIRHRLDLAGRLRRAPAGAAPCARMHFFIPIMHRNSNIFVQSRTGSILAGIPPPAPSPTLS